jgi:hypothetical protein
VGGGEGEKIEVERMRSSEDALSEGKETRKMGEKINGVRDLEVYKLAFYCAMEIFHITKAFPTEERYSLTDQIRRSSRSVCSNLAGSAP